MYLTMETYLDLTYIDDIVQGVVNIIEKSKNSSLYKLYNIGNSSPIHLMDFIKSIEKNRIVAKKEMLPCKMETFTKHGRM